MAKLMLSEMNVLILDEPTNHLDIRSREALEDALLAYDGTLIAVSHDRYFMKKLATRVVILGENGCVNCIGGYEDYRARRDGGDSPAASAAPPSQSDAKEAYLKRKQDAAELRKKKARLRTVLGEIEKLEVALADITDELFGPAATDYMRAAELADEKTVTEDRLMQLYEEEEALENEISANGTGD
jgi:ATP-binding cassette subfamily F protein 3